MSIATSTSEQNALRRPDFFRLPPPGVSDPFFGFSRAYFYEGEKRKWWKLIRIRDRGKDRGVTLIPYEAVAAFVRSRAHVDSEQISETAGTSSAQPNSKQK